MMKIKNVGTMRIRLDKALYIKTGQVLEVSAEIGNWAISHNIDIIDITPKPKYKPKRFNKIEVKENGV